MSTGKSITTQTNFASKLLGKAHTSNLKTDVNESIPSNVSVPSKTVFGEDIPNDPGTAFYTLYSASAGGPATVEQVYFDIVSISIQFMMQTLQVVVEMKHLVTDIWLLP